MWQKLLTVLDHRWWQTPWGTVQGTVAPAGPLCAALVAVTGRPYLRQLEGLEVTFSH